MGFHVFGFDGITYLANKNITLHAASFWSNQEIKTSHRFNYQEELNITPDPANFNIFLPHWGSEMELYPRKEQISFAQNLLKNNWDAIIGNHTHCPQPIQVLNNKPIAYSLGNFCYKNQNPNHWYGRIVKLDLYSNKKEKPI